MAPSLLEGPTKLTMVFSPTTRRRRGSLLLEALTAPALFMPSMILSFREQHLAEAWFPSSPYTGSPVSKKNPLGNRGLPLTSLVLSVMFKIVQARGARASNLQRL